MRTLLITTFITLLATTANAQIQGYAVAGPATTMGFVNHSRITFNAAGGGEVLLGEYFAAGGEGGFFNRLITASANASLHLGASDRVSPFVTTGYSKLGIGDGEGAFNAWNLGGGIDAWIGDRAGVRFELRDHIRPDDRGATHYWAFRVGVVFR
jgi:hypothetical protein